MLSKTLALACAASALMAGGAFAQSPTWRAVPPATSTSVPAEQIDDSPTSPNTVNPMPQPNSTWSAAPVGSQTDVSVNVPDLPAATVTTELVTNGPVPDTPRNRARFGGPQSHAGKMTRPAGN